MNKAFLLFVLSLTYLQPSLSQDTITYTVYFPNAVHHEAEISLRLERVQSKELTAIMSKSSPGRYSIHDFGKNIYNIKAYDDDNVSVSIQKIEPDVWSLAGINNTLNVSYTLYANHADGTYSGIDAEFANLNMPATLLWIKGMESLPVKVIFNLPDTSSWKIAT
ncbi:MAG: M61 family peptidase, partial [Cyclobacteriaceae bacterium]|nr:M61 family peptidase [Cyclobacteriaceae bacterium]